MKKSFRLATIMVVSLLFPISYAFSQTTYQVCQSGDWASGVLFSSDGGATCTTTSANLLAALADGDIIRVPNGFTVTFTTLVDIDEVVTMEIFGTINFDNGKIHLTDNGSTMVLEVGGHLLCTGSCGANDQIKIGQAPNYLYNGSELDDLENSPRPAVIDNTGAILPVLIEDYEAKVVNGTVVLSWITTMEEDFSEFVIEQSTDGSAYIAIGTLKGQGKNLYDVDSKYSFTHENPFVGRNYYRLKAVDIDNSIEYFGPLSVSVKAEKAIRVYPNPSKGEKLTLKTNFTPSETDRLVLINQLGIEMLNAPAQNAEATFVFDNALETGVYFLKYVGKEFNSTTRVIISK